VRVERPSGQQELRNGTIGSFEHHQPRQRRAARWQTADLLAHILPRKPHREQLLDLSSSLIFARFEQLGRVLLIQVRRKRAQCTQVQFPASHALERIWKSPTNPRRRHSPTRRALTHPQTLDAIRKQGGEPEIQMEPTLVELN